MHNFCLPENCKVVEALTPAADAGGRTSDVVSLKNALKVWVLVLMDQGAANTVALTPMQASAVAGTGGKVLSQVAEIWANEDQAATDTLVRQTAAKNFTTSAATKHKLVIFEVNVADLDVANGFDCLYITTGASAAANITSALFFILERYASATPPSAIID